MLTGKLVFSGESVTDTLAEVIKSEPNWSRLPSNTPMPIRVLLQRCLKKDPRRRLQAIGEARIGIEEVLAGNTGVDDDGAKVSTTEKGHPAVVRGGELVEITHDAAMKSRPRWSPDGSTLAYSQLNESGTMDVWEVAALGGSPRKVMLNATDPSWTPDGRSLIYADYADGQIRICGVSGENPRLLVRMGPDEVATELRMSPDGKMVAITVRSTGGGPNGRLGVADLSTGKVRLLTQGTTTTLSPAWSPDSRFIYFASSRGGTLNSWKIGADGNRLRQVTAGEGDDSELDVSSDGKRLAFATMRLNIGLSEFDVQVKAGESRIKILTSDPARNEFGPAYSRDGWEKMLGIVALDRIKVSRTTPVSNMVCGLNP
jgi:WD40 repeat protein